MKNFIYGVYKFVESLVMFIPVHFIRLTFLKIMCLKIGANIFVSRKIEIKNPRNIQIGNNCVINKRVLLDGRGVSQFLIMWISHKMFKYGLRNMILPLHNIA